VTNSSNIKSEVTSNMTNNWNRFLLSSWECLCNNFYQWVEPLFWLIKKSVKSSSFRCV